MSEQPQSSPSQIFYFEVIAPAMLLFFIIYGLPPILAFAMEVWRSETECSQPSVEATPTESPPASVTGPPVTGDGGDTG